MSLEYFKGVCKGDMHWLSLVLLDLTDDGKQADTPQGAQMLHTGHRCDWHECGGAF